MVKSLAAVPALQLTTARAVPASVSDSMSHLQLALPLASAVVVPSPLAVLTRPLGSVTVKVHESSDLLECANSVSSLPAVTGLPNAVMVTPPPGVVVVVGGAVVVVVGGAVVVVVGGAVVVVVGGAVVVVVGGAVVVVVGGAVVVVVGGAVVVVVLTGARVVVVGGVWIGVAATDGPPLSVKVPTNLLETPPAFLASIQG